MTFENSLTAIGGLLTSLVEVLQNDTWNDSYFEPVPGIVVGIRDFSCLAIDNVMLLFGKLSHLICIKIKKIKILQ